MKTSKITSGKLLVAVFVSIFALMLTGLHNTANAQSDQEIQLENELLDVRSQISLLQSQINAAINQGAPASVLDELQFQLFESLTYEYNLEAQLDDLLSQDQSDTLNNPSVQDLDIQSLRAYIVSLEEQLAIAIQKRDSINVANVEDQMSSYQAALENLQRYGVDLNWDNWYPDYDEYPNYIYQDAPGWYCPPRRFDGETELPNGKTIEEVAADMAEYLQEQIDACQEQLDIANGSEVDAIQAQLDAAENELAQKGG